MRYRTCDWPPLEPTLTREELVAGLRAYFQYRCAVGELAERPTLLTVVAVLEEITRALGLSAGEREEILGAYVLNSGDPHAPSHGPTPVR